MGDSDDDGDYKRRDKFRTERRGYDGPADRGISPRHERSEWRDSRGGGGRGGGGWNDRRSGYDQQPGYRSRDRYPSPPGRRHGGGGGDMSPPHKRMRDDWEDRYDSGYSGHSRGGSDFYSRGHMRSSYSTSSLGSSSIGVASLSSGRAGGAGATGDSDLVQPPMMTFKAFLTTQDDGISDEEAIKKYGEYKLEFKRQQLNEFFVSHKDEEWFKLKYHPEESAKRHAEQKAMLQKRVDVFMDFYNKKKFDQVSIDGEQSEQLVKLLDSVVILLEGGTEFDFQVLDRPDEEEKKVEGEETSTSAEAGSKANQEAVGSHDDKEKKAEDGDSQMESEPKAEGGKGRKRKRTQEYDGEEDSEVSSSSEEEEGAEEDGPPGLKKEKAKTEAVDVQQNGSSEAGPKEKENGNGSLKSEDKKEANEADNEDDGSKPRALHKTTSIFLRNLAPTITKQEVEAMCKRYPGFLRAAISDPQPERRWFRRGWVTFERTAKIKEICYSFNSIRLRDCELGPIVNRDLSRRIRTVTGLTVDKKVVRNDIRLAAKVITNLDKRWGLWSNIDSADGEDVKKETPDETSMVSLVSNNPLLSNITDYLIEEASAEEEELLGKNNDLEEGEEGEDGNTIVRDEEIIKVLDRLLLYLRIVHSVDYYNHCEYPNEDEMPNRCGIMHARASIPAGGKAAPFEIEEYCAMFEKKMGSFLQPRSMLSDDDAAKLGMKNEEDEVEKFVQANTQELGKDKWLCPLSGKKFKGPDFVRKHIFNKHAEKVEEVKKEVKYYNNYLKDPRRPQLPENPQNKAAGAGGAGGGLSRHASQRELGGGRYDYHYSGYPREATSYPVYDDGRPERSGYDRGYDRGGYRGRPRYDHYGGGRGGGRIHDRVGGGHPHGPRVTVTQVEPDPRSVIDYSDVDFTHDPENLF